MTDTIESIVHDINVEYGPVKSVWISSVIPEQFYSMLTSGPVNLANGMATLIDSSGDRNDDPYEAESIWFVFQYNGELYRIDGSNNSWEGPTYDTAPYKVQGREVTNMVYVRP